MWLSESYSCNFQITVYKNIWELASDTDIVCSFQKCSKNGRGGEMPTHILWSIFLQRMIWKTHEYDSESHIQELHADMKICEITIQKGAICYPLNNFFISGSIRLGKFKFLQILRYRIQF